MDEIERADVEGRWNANLTAERCHPFDEVEARPAEVEASVDMRRLDGDQAPRVDRLGEADDEAHGEGGAGAMVAAEKFAIERGEFESHRAKDLAACGLKGNALFAPLLPRECMRS